MGLAARAQCYLVDQSQPQASSQMGEQSFSTWPQQRLIVRTIATSETGSSMASMRLEQQKTSKSLPYAQDPLRRSTSSSRQKSKQRQLKSIRRGQQRQSQQHAFSRPNGALLR